MPKEYALWGKPQGKTDGLDEMLLYSRAKSKEALNPIIEMARKQGFHSFRIQVLDLEEPWNASRAFAKTLTHKKGSK